VNQAIHNIEDGDGDLAQRSSRSRIARVLPPLLVAILCTILIAEAIAAVADGRRNGDLMVIVCPILGATFFSIPAAQAWWTVIKRITKG